MTEKPLTEEELALWHAWRKATEAVMAAVARDVADATGLSGPDYSVLSRLVDAGGMLRQQDLCSSMGWEKSRLSHHLTRMAERGLVLRRPTGHAGALIAATDLGRERVTAARPVHARAVRQHFTEPAKAELPFQALLESLSKA